MALEEYLQVCIVGHYLKHCRHGPYQMSDANLDKAGVPGLGYVSSRLPLRLYETGATYLSGYL